MIILYLSPELVMFLFGSFVSTYVVFFFSSSRLLLQEVCVVIFQIL